MATITPPQRQSGSNAYSAAKQPRSSNLELYRIVCMLMIVAHHYVVNSGLTSAGGPLKCEPTSINSLFLWLFGAWGKTGINCFLMITGYFMCTSKITLRKFVKLMAQIYCIRFIIFPILLIGGYETLSLTRIAKLLMPVWGFNQNFTSCFILFWLTIPFLNILVQHMNKRQHQFLLLLLLGAYTVLGSIPTFSITFNYVTWFAVLFLVASYIRLYPHPVFERKALWGWLTLAMVLTAMGSIVVMLALLAGKGAYWLLSDSNKFFALAVAVCSFLWFKNMDIRQSKVINALGAGTFGVLLIHANSDAMRQWLWKDTVDVVGHYTLPLGQLVLFSLGVVLTVFVVCNLLDQLRIHCLEKPFLKWYDKHLDEKLNKKINQIMTV